MIDQNEKEYFFDKPKNVKWMMRGFYALCILLFIADFVIHRHVVLDWEKIPAFYAIYSFAACLILVIIAKGLRKIVMRKEDYYDE